MKQKKSSLRLHAGRKPHKKTEENVIKRAQTNTSLKETPGVLLCSLWRSCRVVTDLPSTRCRCRAAAQPHTRPRSPGSDTVPPLLSVQPTWPTCRSRTEPQRCNFPSVCGFKWSSGASHRRMVAAESWNLKCGLDSPERWTYGQICFCIFSFLPSFFFFFFLNPGFLLKCLSYGRTAFSSWRFVLDRGSGS